MRRWYAAHCGGPRAEGALTCSYCGADFSLHERDLDTVCPRCFARVSNKSRFCHFCGSSIQPEMLAGQASTCICPACGPEHTLTSRAWGDISALECSRCAGLWLSNESIKHLTEAAAVQGLQVQKFQRAREARPAEAEGPPPDGGKRYRPCAVCRELMVKRNFGPQSGVIVDVCGKHGTWFDADELPRILDWVRAGGLARAVDAEAQKEKDEEAIRKAHAGSFGTGGGYYPDCEPPVLTSGSGSLVGWAIEEIGRAIYRIFSARR